MEFLQQTARYTLSDHKKNKEILENLKMDSLEEKFHTYTNYQLHYIC
jgi:hypothetical protein